MDKFHKTRYPKPQSRPMVLERFLLTALYSLLRGIEASFSFKLAILRESRKFARAGWRDDNFVNIILTQYCVC